MNFLEQTKLTKSEWDKMEKPIQNENEKNILKMIYNGFNNININYNPFICLYEYLKIDNKFDTFIFNKILKDKLNKINKSNILLIDSFLSSIKDKTKMSNSDLIKMKNSIEKINDTNKNIIEFIILDEIKQLSKILKKKDFKEDKKYSLIVFNIYTIFNEYKNKINKHLVNIIDEIIKYHIPNLHFKNMIQNVTKFIEHNYIFNYKTLSLYQHQKDIFSVFNSNNNKSKFIFYCAPTSSGKTLTPLALTNKYKVLFVCASKHIGLSLAKSAFFLKKKIGFAFGSKDKSNIRLNFNAVKTYITVNNGRKIPDHSDGTNVEIMISDLISFESAMLYMKSFHSLENIILFWDEPTIGLDVENHYLHNIIEHNWKCNIIPNVVFSCATLPKEDKIQNIISSFKNKFNNSMFKYIESYDQFTNLIIYDEYGNVIMPHIYFQDYNKMILFLKYQDKKYYKFYNCNECAKFIIFYDKYINKNTISNNFDTITKFTLNNIKDVYLNCLFSINSDKWNEIQDLFFQVIPLNNNSETFIGPNITTNNANSLTNGPTLYISDKIENICKYLLKKSNIPNNIINVINEKINNNTKISEKIFQKEKDYEDKIEKYKDNDNIMENMRLPPDILELYNEIEKLKQSILNLTIDSIYKPNMRDHYNKWNNSNISFEESDVFSSYIDDDDLKNIMQLYTLQPIYKILFLLGIGIFSNNVTDTNEENRQKDIKIENNKYIEQIKFLAEQKSLYLILADSDYIYGTNYQFSHCYLGKDMQNMTQEKIIQCIGRIGRQEKNKHFSFRFRSKQQIDILYSIPENNIEANNMNKLFN